MNIQNKSRVEDAVYWPVLLDALGHKIVDAHGQPQYLPPQAIKVKWIDSIHLVTGSNGEQRQSRAFIIVDATIEFELTEMLWKGLLVDLPVGFENTPKMIDDASQIISVDDLSDLKGRSGIARVKMVHL